MVAPGSKHQVWIVFFWLCLGVSCAGMTPSERESTAQAYQSLFYIERSTNRNVLHYGIELTLGDGERRYTVQPYWVMLEEEGQLEGLSWFEGSYAYGLEWLGETQSFYLNSLKSKKLWLSRLRAQPVVLTAIAGEISGLKRIFVMAEGGLWQTVQYVDLSGVSLESKREVTERIFP